MNIDFFNLLQINDATFPIGSFSFSWGLETFVQQGKIFDSESSFEFLKSELEESFIYSDLLAVRLAYENFSNPQKIQELDEIFTASKTPYEIREASRKLANRFTKTVIEMKKENGKTGKMKDENGKMKKDSTSTFNSQFSPFTFQFSIFNFPLAYGVYCAENEIEKESALSAFLYSQTSARVTNLVKLVPLSQTDGQKILHKLIQIFPNIIEENEQLSEDDFCRSCPSIDIRCMQHEFLYTRLYSN